MNNKQFYRQLRLIQEQRHLTPFERKVWQSQRGYRPLSDMQSAMIGLVATVTFFVGCLWLSL
jgi:hypothetical protein